MMDIELGYTRLIMRTAEENGCSLTQTAYILATAYHETAFTMKPVRETLAKTDVAAVQSLEHAWQNGKLSWVKTPYWRADQNGRHWFGRGFVQLTWEDNYQEAERETGYPFHTTPDTALQPVPAATVLVRGMMEGWFGRPLTRFVNNHLCDYRKARQSVNGMDRAAQIAKLAEGYEETLRTNGFQAGQNSMFRRYPVTRFDDRGFAVKHLQESLNALNYGAGRVDGIFGQDTRAAVLAFQANNGLATDGVIEEDDWKALEQGRPRPVSTGRSRTSVTDLRRVGSETVKSADRGEAVSWTAVGTGVLGGAGALSGGQEPSTLQQAATAADTASSIWWRVQPILSTLGEMAPFVLIAAGVCAVVYFKFIKKERVRKAATGLDMSR